MRIDAHQHFWQFDPVRDSWITDYMAVLQRDFMPADLHPFLTQNGFDGCVAVQADQSEKETEFLVQLASKNDFIKGVVGWVDLQADTINDRLAYYKQFDIVKGFRHILQGESQRDLMLMPRFKKGIAALQQFGFTYDVLIFPDQLKYANELVGQLPDQKFVIDHLAKPPIKEQKIAPWREELFQIAQHENLYCKLSGLVTEADWQNWKKDDFKCYMDAVVEAFGVNRILFGTDWPVCLVAASYKQTVDIVQDYFAAFTEEEQQKVFGKNAVRFYNL
ncbi:amidohydrolase family protein [Flavisolibacter tropicus]|uniref:Amidohydrolase n=1 Tax=Flavisolibacter tropicus TaxID=1492898 RepID=A0A172TXD6_9BACT|nr:amidohydrolase family protein [Flavisolibacter tropicus]ANE51397.1 amidohydrolase [Flavisolibacter tropicus]